MQASFSVRVGEIERRLVLQAAAVAGVSARLVTRDL
jgi:hypothetical protein